MKFVCWSSAAMYSTQNLRPASLTALRKGPKTLQFSYAARQFWENFMSQEMGE